MKTILLDTEQAVSILTSYYKAGARLHFFNGAQWYIDINGMVAVMDTGSRDNCTLDFMRGRKAAKYLTSGGGNCTEENAFRNSLKSFTELVGIG
tara:strand:- start:364 stop:645 length:282 start_codon:yes stop_codon:yes gene_type:complete